ncbi:MAG: Na+/H+ antiporter subunit G [Bradymonadaceae bacterium]
MDAPFTVQLAVSFFLVAGAALMFLGSLGLVKLPDYYSRLHPPAKNTTLGLGSILFASTIYFSTTQPGLTVREFLITLFLFMTAPVSAHLMGKAALHLDAEFVDRHAHDDTDREVYRPSERQKKQSE